MNIDWICEILGLYDFGCEFDGLIWATKIIEFWIILEMLSVFDWNKKLKLFLINLGKWNGLNKTFDFGLVFVAEKDKMFL